MRSRNRQWNQFFSSLAFAEKAAAEQCELIADAYAGRGDRKSEMTYRKYAEEEREHFSLVSSICREVIAPPLRAMQVYQGALLSPSAGIAERLATLHLGFEPSALAFLGYFYRNAHELLDNEEWARQARAVFRDILRDEVTHVQLGKECFEQEWDRSSRNEKQVILRSLRRHRAFLSLGLKSFFRNPGLATQGLPFVRSVIDDYQIRVAKLCSEFVA
jgi:hypothetical protein